MKSIFTLILFLSLSIALFAEIKEETGSLKGFIYGSEPACEYDDWMLHITKKVQRENYNVYAPFTRNSINSPFGTYRIPNPAEFQQWEQICEYFIKEDFTKADELLTSANIPYKIVRFNDKDTGRQYYMLRETLNKTLFDDQGTPETTDDVRGGFDYSWGLYVVSPKATLPIILTLVHPGDDYTVPPLIVKAFEEWDAKYLMIASASREATGDQQGYFINNFSTSDPSRNQEHPLNRFYLKASDEIRTTFGRPEYSVQLHSYDWASETHQGVSNIQISANPEPKNLKLPVRDLSSFRIDVVNLTDYLVFPANTIGIHAPVSVTDYYTVHYDPALQPFYFENSEHKLPVPNKVTAPVATTNVQYKYTMRSPDANEPVDRFLHIELDELPNCYPQTETYWKWFYGYDISTQSFDMKNRYKYTLEYYSPFIEKMGVAIRTALIMDDDLPVKTPENFIYLSQGTHIHVGWTPIECYDFDTYEILYYTENSGQLVIRDKSKDPSLGLAKTNYCQIDGLSKGNTYIISIRAKDRNGNVSPVSPEISVYLEQIVSIRHDKILSLDNSVFMQWRGVYQSPAMVGIKIYRTTIGGETVLVESYETLPSLLSNSSSTQEYSYTDNTAVNFSDYVYYIVACSSTTEYINHLLPSGYTMTSNFHASPRPMYQLYFTNTTETVSDSVTLGFSPYASDDMDKPPVYDVVDNSYPPHMIRSDTRFSRDIKEEFDRKDGFKTFNIRLRSDQGNVKMFLKNLGTQLAASNNKIVGTQLAASNRPPDKIVLEDENATLNVNLRASRHSFSIPNSQYRNYKVHIGDIKPELKVTTTDISRNKIYTSGEVLSFSYTTRFSSLLDHYRIKLANTNSEVIIRANTTAHTGSISFTIPNGVTLHDASLVFMAHCTDGEIIEHYTPLEIGILPSSANITSTTQTSENLSHGWNSIQNLFLYDLQIKDIDFEIDEKRYTYAELLLGNVLLPYVRIYRNGKLTDTELVSARETFLLYANLPVPSVASIVFTPYKKNPAITPSNPLWQNSITAQYENNELMTPIVDAVVSSLNPNSVYPTVEIAFALSEGTYVECAVYNSKGQKVKTITSQFLSSGNHTLSWDGKDTLGRVAKSGIYFMSVTPLGQSGVVKTVVLP